MVCARRVALCAVLGHGRVGRQVGEGEGNAPMLRMDASTALPPFSILHQVPCRPTSRGRRGRSGSSGGGGREGGTRKRAEELMGQGVREGCGGARAESRPDDVGREGSWAACRLEQALAERLTLEGRAAPWRRGEAGGEGRGGGGGEEGTARGKEGAPREFGRLPPAFPLAAAKGAREDARKDTPTPLNWQEGAGCIVL